MPLLFAFVIRLSMLGPRESFTDMRGSTGSSHSQQRHPSRSPMSSSLLIATTLRPCRWNQPVGAHRRRGTRSTVHL